MNTLYGRAYRWCALLASAAVLIVAAWFGDPAWLQHLPALLRLVKPKGETKMLSIKQVAEKMGQSEKSVRRWIKAGKLRTVQMSPGGKHMIPESEVERIIKARLK